MNRETSPEIQQGMKIRREVLGDEYVDKATSDDRDFFREFQDIIAGKCWGAVWGRGTLSRRDRSLLTLAMLAAMNREQEFGIHFAGAIRNGCTAEELKELCIHVNAYCGAPAAVGCFRALRKVIEEFDIKV